MMLPSGNDAAFALAEHFGDLIYHEKYSELDCTESSIMTTSFQQVSSWQFNESMVKYFLKEMNLNAHTLKMSASNFDSPHGLMNKYNYSSAYDMCIITMQCMKYPLFREVVRTKQYTCYSLKKSKNPYVWENTNKLLYTFPQFIGCKTGITDSAGPCFSGCYEDQGESICIVVLNSKNME